MVRERERQTDKLTETVRQSDNDGERETLRQRYNISCYSTDHFMSKIKNITQLSLGQTYRLI